MGTVELAAPLKCNSTHALCLWQCSHIAFTVSHQTLLPLISTAVRQKLVSIILVLTALTFEPEAADGAVIFLRSRQNFIFFLAQLLLLKIYNKRKFLCVLETKTRLHAAENSNCHIKSILSIISLIMVRIHCDRYSGITILYSTR